MGELPLHANSSTPRRAFSGPVGSSNYSHLQGLLLLFRHAVVSNSVQPHGLRHARHPRPSEESIFNIISFCLFTLTVHGVLRQECWSGLLFPSSVDHLQGRGQKTETVFISQEALSFHSLCSHDHTTLLGKHQESGAHLCNTSRPLFEDLCLLGHILPSSEEIPLEASLMAQWLRLHVSTAVGVGSIPGQRTKILHASQVEWGPPLKKRKKEISLDHLGLHDCYSSAIVSSTGGTEGKASLPPGTHSCIFLQPLRTLLDFGYLTPQVYSIVAPEPLPKVTWAVPE